MIEYTIRPGDTLFKLSVQYHIPMPLILAANPGLNPYNMMIGQVIKIPVIAPAMQQGSTDTELTIGELNLRNTLRSLWEQHVAWTRMTILSAAADSPDLNNTIDRLLRNATDMAGALKPLYGNVNATKFGSLIHDHLTIALQLVEAAKQGDQQAVKNYEKEWYANADKIVDFLGSINPYIDKNEFRNMFYNHLKLTEEEAVERLNKEYQKDIETYDRIEEQALDMADLMSEAIIKQFPETFR